MVLFIISIKSRFKKVLADIKVEKAREEEAKLGFEPIYESYAARSNARREDEERDQVLEKILLCMNKLNQCEGFQLESYQSQAEWAMLTSSLENIYGKTLYKRLTYLIKKLGITDLIQYVMLDFPRRSGKTYVGGRFIGVIAFCRPGSVINIYSLTRENSARVADESKKTIFKLMDLFSENIRMFSSLNGIVLDFQSGKKSVIKACQGKNYDIRDGKSYAHTNNSIISFLMIYTFYFELLYLLCYFTKVILQASSIRTHTTHTAITILASIFKTIIRYRISTHSYLIHKTSSNSHICHRCHRENLAYTKIRIG